MSKRDKKPLPKVAQKAQEVKVHKKVKIWWIRRLVQLTSFTLFNAGIWGLGPWPIILPILVYFDSSTKTVAGSYELLEYMLSEAVMPWIALASILLFTVLIGRATCGWLCPLGFIQDMLTHLKIGRWQPSLRTHNSLKNLKYGVLLVVLLISGSIAAATVSNPASGQRLKDSLGKAGQGPYSAVDPLGTLFVVIPKLPLAWARILPSASDITWDSFTKTLPVLLPSLLVVRLILLLVFLIGSIYLPRFWCLYVCPLGAFMALINRFRFLGLRRDPVRCTKCRDCVELCPMRVRILDLPFEKFNDAECTLCLDCQDACTEDAIKLKAP